MLYRGITLVVVMNQQLTTLCVVAVHGGGVEASDLQLSRSLRFRDMLMGVLVLEEGGCDELRHTAYGIWGSAFGEGAEGAGGSTASLWPLYLY